MAQQLVAPHDEKTAARNQALNDRVKARLLIH
jgi:hypothetical protein